MNPLNEKSIFLVNLRKFRSLGLCLIKFKFMLSFVMANSSVSNVATAATATVATTMTGATSTSINTDAADATMAASLELRWQRPSPSHSVARFVNQVSSIG